MSAKLPSSSVVSEAASEKRRRGRPPVFCKEWMYLARGRKTRRGVVEYGYALCGTRVLMHQPAYAWLFAVNRGRDGRIELLAALGRISIFGADADAPWGGPSHDLVKEYARRLCMLKPLTKDGLAMIRRWEYRRVMSEEGYDIASPEADADPEEAGA